MADLAPLTYGRVVGRFLAIVGALPEPNFHTNPDFETDTSTWVATGAASISRVTTEFHSGVASLRVITTAAVADGTGAILSGLSLGTEEYAVGFWVKAPLGAAMMADINLWNTTLGAFSAATRNFTGTGDWQWVDTPGVGRADGADQIVALVRSAAAAAITFYVDDATAGGVSPEAVAPTGTVTFIPSASEFVRIGGAEGGPATVVLRPIVTTLDAEGYVNLNGQKGVRLVASDDPAVTDEPFTYSVIFDLRYEGLNIPIPDRTITVLAGQTYDLGGDLYFPLNIMFKGSFETGAPDDTAPSVGASITRDLTWSNSGTSSLKITGTGGSNVTAAFPPGYSSNHQMKTGHFYTVIATCRLSAPLTGTQESISRRLTVFMDGSTAVVNQQAPNLAGEHELRGTFEFTGETVMIQLGLGAASGGGSIWWDDVIVVEVEDLAHPYTGPLDLFLADSPY